MASDLARNLIKKEEKLMQQLYDDATGKPIVKGTLVEGFPSIAYGWNLQTHPLPVSICDELFDIAILDAEARMVKDFGPEILQESETRVAALLSMTFNLGSITVLPKTTQAIRDRNWEEAANEGADSKWYRETGARAVEIVQMIREG